MFVKMTQSPSARIKERYESFQAGTVYELDDAIGAAFVRAGLGERTNEPPEFIRTYLDRINEGAGGQCLFLPYLGWEFGHLVMTHVRFVHFHKSAHKIVACRQGEEVLFPSAKEFIYFDDSTHDMQRAGPGRGDGILASDWEEMRAQHPGATVIDTRPSGRTQEFYCIEAGWRIPFSPQKRGLNATVCLGIRSRQFEPQRNWPYWPEVAKALKKRRVDFAVVGKRPTSFDVPGQKFHAGDYQDTDATIEAIQGCKLFVGSNTGTSHLAAAAGAKMIVFPNANSFGGQFIDNMAKVNTGNVKCVENGWADYEAVIEAIFAALPKVDKKAFAHV